MVKLKIAFTFAIISCILTIFSALTEHVRISTLFYRMIVSMLLFGVVGYFVSGFIQKYISRLLIKLQQNEDSNDVLQNPLPDNNSSDGKDTEFRPLTVQKLEHISETKQ
jgi:hypothetical protein